MAPAKASKNKANSSKRKSKSSNVKVYKTEAKPVSKSMLGVSFSRLKPITIETGWLTRVSIVGDGIIDLNNSWEDFILTLLGLIYSEHPDKFMGILADNRVLSDGLNTNTKLINYPESANIKYEVYKLTNSPYYIEFRQDGIAYIQAIKGLLEALKINIKDISFDIEPLNIQVDGVNTTYKDIKQSTINETLASVIRKNNTDIDIISIKIFGYKQKVKSTQQALLMFMTWAEASYGTTLEKAGVDNSTPCVGMTTASHIDEYSDGFATAKIGSKYLYYCTDNSSILRYIGIVATSIGISPELIEVEYRQLELT